MSMLKCVYPNLDNVIWECGSNYATIASLLTISMAELYNRLYGRTAFLPREQNVLSGIFDADPAWLFYKEDSNLKNKSVSHNEIGCLKSLLDTLPDQETPKGKTCAFYLDREVAFAVERLADAVSSNKSKVVNAILRSALL